MTTKKISQLTAASALTGVELVPVVQGGVTKRSTVTDIVTMVILNSGAVTTTGSQTVTGLKTFRTANSASYGLIVRGVAGQAADLQQWQDSTGTAVSRVGADGQLYVGADPVALTGSHTFAQALPVLEWSTNGAAALLHLSPGPGFTGPYVFGIGLPYNGGLGFKISVGAPGCIGGGFSLEPTSVAYPIGADATSIGIPGSNFTAGTLLQLAKGGQNTGPLLSLRADYGGTGRMLSWGRTVGNESGWVDETGAFCLAHDTADPTLRSLMKVAGGAAGMAMRFYGRTGAPNLWFPSAIFTSGEKLHIGISDSAANIGAEIDRTVVTLIPGGNVGVGTETPVAKLSVSGVSAAVVALIVKGAPAQTANLQEWHDSAGGVAASMTVVGAFAAATSVATTILYISNAVVTPSIQDSTFTGPYLTMAATSASITNRTSASNVALIIQGMASQTGDLLQSKNSAGTVLFTVNAAGEPTLRSSGGVRWRLVVDDDGSLSTAA